MIRFSTLILFSLLIIGGCTQRDVVATTNRFADSVYVRIFEWQDRRQTDSLLTFLTSASPYREAALIALGSVQDSAAASAIGKMLRDGDEEVKAAAAFALGQTRCRESERILSDALTTETNARARARLYEAYGRVTHHWTIPTTLVNDSIEAAGLAWGIFRTSGDSLLNPIANELLRSNAVTVRLGAANYFARKAPRPAASASTLIDVALRDRSDEVRMAAALALRKVPTDDVLAALGKIVRDDPSYRVRVNAVSALQGFPIGRALPLLIQSLNDASTPVAVRAAEVINMQPPDSALQDLARLARAATSFRVKALLYQAAMASSQDQLLFNEIRDRYNRSADAYTKAAYLGAMGKTLMAFAFVRDELMKADTAAIRTAAASALAEMNYSKNFSASLRKDFLSAYREAIALNDMGTTSVVCNVLSDPDLGYKVMLKDWKFLIDAKDKLTLPADNETLQSVESAIAYFEGKTPDPVKNAFNHPIDWDLVHSIPSDQRARIVTSKGVITILLFVDEAPGSVANFIALVREGRYSDKYFHRVVPNFVAQGGCPRGDGYGSESYSIRSEFSRRRYKTGSVGLASAGKDTESSQWFITHSPTPHLDGAYTIFAEVVEGMNIVHQLEVGDKILKIELAGKDL